MITEDFKKYDGLFDRTQYPYLYRAVHPNEWEQIKRNKMMMLITRVNFKKELGPQVQAFAKDLT